MTRRCTVCGTYTEAVTFHLLSCHVPPDERDALEPLAVLAVETGYSRDHLARLIRARLLPGRRLGRTYYTTLQAIRSYRPESQGKHSGPTVRGRLAEVALS